MSSLIGTARLARLIVRRDRLRIAIWVLTIPVVAVLVAWSVKRLQPERR